MSKFNGNIVIGGCPLVDGVLKDQNGKAMSDVELLISSIENEYTVKTNSNGGFDFGLIPVGDYQLYSVDSAGAMYSIDTLEVLKDGKYELNITCDFSGVEADFGDFEVEVISNKIKSGAIKGTVYTPQRKTVANLKIYISKDKYVVTDKNGCFEFNELDAGKYDIYTIEGKSKYVIKSLQLSDNSIATVKIKYDPPVSDPNGSNHVVTWIIVSGSVVLLGAVATVLFIFFKKKSKNK